MHRSESKGGDTRSMIKKNSKQGRYDTLILCILIPMFFLLAWGYLRWGWMGFNRRLVGQTMAAWVQAVGSIGAIYAAIRIGFNQSEREHQRTTQAGYAALFVVRTRIIFLLENALHQIGFLTKNWTEENAIGNDIPNPEYDRKIMLEIDLPNDQQLIQVASYYPKECEMIVRALQEFEDAKAHFRIYVRCRASDEPDLMDLETVLLKMTKARVSLEFCKFALSQKSAENPID